MDKNKTPLFTTFKTEITTVNFPNKFTFPFHYKPHELSKLASKELQDHISSQSDWEHPFGLNPEDKPEAEGKMFGVLVVKNDQGELGYLSAFSGKLADSNHLPGFVPPVFDMLVDGNFFLAGMDELRVLNAEVKRLSNESLFLKYSDELKVEKEKLLTEEKESKQQMKSAKAARGVERIQKEAELNSEAYLELLEKLKMDSMRQKFYYRELAHYRRERIAEAESKLAPFKNIIDQLKEDRKAKSNNLQKQLFEHYSFLNTEGDRKNLLEIFKNTASPIPPGGSGECAAPKLMQYAFLNKLEPIAMAEFWWGKSLKSKVRKHKNYYPACMGKCFPILTHMLKGMKVDENPFHKNIGIDRPVKIVYEDDYMLVVNKPPELLSVPGKVVQDSVFMRMKLKLPTATGPLVVHRLDQSTSGIMLVAKTKDMYKILQSQFIKRTIKKHYTAILDGVVKEDEGVVSLPLRVDFDDRPRQLVCYEYGKSAKTKWEVVSRTDTQTRIHFYPITGRTHQLRVHAAHPLGLNIPILGDDLYGTLEKRLHLHATSISFVHPYTKAEMSFTVPPEF